MCKGPNGAYPHMHPFPHPHHPHLYPHPYPPSPSNGDDLAKRMAEAEQTVRQLTDRIGEIERQLAEVKARKPLHVEYHFDQLKVNELKGTLNVGLSPQGVQGLDSFETPPGSWPQPDQNGSTTNADQLPFADLMRSMDTYMAQEAPVYLASLEQQFGTELDADHRNRLLADVKNQLKDRVHYYAKTSAYPADGTDEERQVWRRSVLDRTIRDVRDALMTYMGKWKINTANHADGGDAS